MHLKKAIDAPLNRSHQLIRRIISIKSSTRFVFDFSSLLSNDSTFCSCHRLPYLSFKKKTKKMNIYTILRALWNWLILVPLINFSMCSVFSLLSCSIHLSLLSETFICDSMTMKQLTFLISHYVFLHIHFSPQSSLAFISHLSMIAKQEYIFEWLSSSPENYRKWS